MARSEVPQPDLGPILARIQERDDFNVLQRQVKTKAISVYRDFATPRGADYYYELEVPTRVGEKTVDLGLYGWPDGITRRLIFDVYILDGSEKTSLYQIDVDKPVHDKISNHEATLEGLRELNSLLDYVRTYCEAQPIVRTGTGAKDAQRISS